MSGARGVQYDARCNTYCEVPPTVGVVACPSWGITSDSRGIFAAVTMMWHRCRPTPPMVVAGKESWEKVESEEAVPNT